MKTLIFLLRVQSLLIRSFHNVMMGKLQQGLNTTAVGLLVCTIFSGCAGSTLFHADFKADSIGAPPAKNPPGSPTGDQIWTGDAPGGSELTVVQSAELNSKAASYRNLDLSIPQRHVAFFSAETSLPASQKFRAHWSGRIDLTPAGSGLQVWLGDNHFGSIASFRFKNGQVWLQTSGGPNPTYETIGTYDESQNHSGIITVNKATAQYSLAIIPGSVLSGWRPVLSTDAMNTSTPTLYFLYYEGNKHGAGKYVVNDITIQKVE